LICNKLLDLEQKSLSVQTGEGKEKVKMEKEEEVKGIPCSPDHRRRRRSGEELQGGVQIGGRMVMDCSFKAMRSEMGLGISAWGGVGVMR
jgi:hypothetical protein